MRIDRLTSKLQAALSDAQSLAVGRDHNFIEPAHMLLALLEQQNGSIAPLLKNIGCNPNSVKQEVLKLIDGLPKVPGHDGDVHMSNDLARLLNLADKQAQQRKDQYISSEIVLLAACDDKGAMGKLLAKLGVNKSVLEKAIEQLRGGEAVNDQGAEENRQALDKYTIDL